jgi:hypothetical protein
MSNKTPRHAQALRDQMVELVRGGRKPPLPAHRPSGPPTNRRRPHAP